MSQPNPSFSDNKPDANSVLQKTIDGLMTEIELKEGPEFDPKDLPLKKRIFYATMIKTFGNITQACVLAGIKRSTYRQWMKNDDRFKELIEGGDFENRLLDFAETKLIDKINKGDTIAIMYFLNNKGKSRGYNRNANTTPPPNPNDKPSWFDTPSLPPPVVNTAKASFEDAQIVSETPNNKSNDSRSEMEL